MSYETHTWESGETITAEKLNHIEDGIAECCSGGDVGYECTETKTLLTEEDVTTAVDPEYPPSFSVGEFSYLQLIDADTIRVTFNGTEYICNKREIDDYGAIYDDDTQTFDWS